VTDDERDQLAQETAEHIAEHLSHRAGGVTYHYDAAGPPPRDLAAIKAALLDGRVWLSWLDDRVFATMRELHGPLAVVNAPARHLDDHAAALEELAQAKERLTEAQQCLNPS
jgi:hypothetical protein